MTVSELIYEHKKKFPESHFFDPETLRFFGERRSEMSVHKTIYKVKDSEGKTHDCYCLSRFQRIPLLGKRRMYTMFDTTTFEEVNAD